MPDSPQKLTKPLARFVELGFGIADGTTEQASDLVVLVAMHVVQEEHGFVPSGQLSQRIMNLHAVEDTSKV